MKGKVISTRRARVRGKQHLIAMMTGARGEGKIAVDLGPADQLDVKVGEGAGITFRGVPIKVKDRKMLMALHIKDDRGKWKQIDRRRSKPQRKSRDEG